MDAWRKKKLCEAFVRNGRVRYVKINDDDSQPLLLYGPGQKLGQIAEGNLLSKKEQTVRLNNR